MSVYKGVNTFVKCQIENIVVLKVEGIRQGARRGSELQARSGAWRGAKPGGEWSQLGTGARSELELGGEQSQAGSGAMWGKKPLQS